MTITITPYLLYADVDAALAFLARAFGFEEVLRHAGGRHFSQRIGDVDAADRGATTPDG